MGQEVKSNRAVIFGSAPMASFENLKRYLRADDCIICADGGRRLAERMGLTPHFYVGDSDSGGSPEGLPAVVLPCEKDLTDLEAAIDQAIVMGYRSILLSGCTGGRADHHVTNLCLLEAIDAQGAEAIIVDEVNEIRLLKPGRIVLENCPSYHYLSLLPLDRVLHGVSIEGCKYPLDGFDLLRSSSRGVSNEILSGQRAGITVTDGVGLLIRSDPQ